MSAVVLNIYDCGVDDNVSAINGALRMLGTGAFHAGVEAFDEEWSFGYSEGTGVFTNEPKGCKMHRYRESIQMGQTNLKKSEFHKLLEELKKQWPGRSYSLLRVNCCHFSDALCTELGVGHIPKWVLNLSGAGAIVQDGIFSAHSNAESLAIIAAAKAGEIDWHKANQAIEAGAAGLVGGIHNMDKQYSISKKTSAAASSAIGSVQEFDKEHQVSELAVGSWRVVSEVAGAIGEGFGKLDEEHQISRSLGDRTVSAADSLGSATEKAADALADFDQRHKVSETVIDATTSAFATVFNAFGFMSVASQAPAQTKPSEVPSPKLSWECKSCGETNKMERGKCNNCGAKPKAAPTGGVLTPDEIAALTGTKPTAAPTAAPTGGAGGA